MKTRNWLAFSIAAYAATWISLLALVSFVGELGDRTVSTPPAGGHWMQAAVVNLLLLALFGIQHSAMARPRLKQAMARAVPGFATRSVFTLVSACTLLLIINLWQPLDAVLWQVEWRPLKLALLGAFCLGVLIILWATAEIDHFHFFGVKQCVRALVGEPQSEPAFRATGLYGVVRHPIHLGMLMLLWSAPKMTAGHLMFAAGMTAYVLIGLRLEERDLVASLGRVYRNYIARIPMLLPGPRRARRGDDERDDNGIFWGFEAPRLALPSRAVAVFLLLAASLCGAVVLEPFHAGKDRPALALASSPAPDLEPRPRMEP